MDISDPVRPRTVSTTAQSDYGFCVQVVGNYAYVCNGQAKLNIYDISSKAAPVLLSTITARPGFYNHMKLLGKYLYVAFGNGGGLEIFDISNPSNPIFVGQDSPVLGTSNSDKRVFLLNGYAHVVGTSNTGNNYLKIVNVADPSSPTTLGYYQMTNGSNAVYVSGKYAYVMENNNIGLRIFDISNPASITLLSTFSITATPVSTLGEIVVNGRYAYITYGSNGLQIVDVSDPTAPAAVGGYTTGLVGTTDVFIQGKYAYVSDFSGTTYSILDIGGADIDSANIGSVKASDVSITNNLDVANRLLVNSGLNVGPVGIMSAGPLTISATTTSGVFWGNVGIGTTTPWGLLSVNANGIGAGPQFVVGSSTKTNFVITNAGNVGIATTSPWRTLSLTGTLALSSSLTSATTGNYLCINTSNYEITSGTTCSASSERFKDNIRPITYGLSDILKLNPISFTYKKEVDPNDQSKKLGFIAEQVNPLIPELIAKDKDGLPESVDYAKLAPVLTRALQEEDAKISALILNPQNTPPYSMMASRLNASHPH
ncbi:MAG: tail fiber domain-containing protein [Candidatus Sungbacteria bacterium]|nr:tail fiber domain-containing protein [Candidatus Sungbacteria bacterium]